MTAHPNSASWQLKARTPRKGHIEINARLKPDYASEMETRARWVREYWAAVAAGNTERMKELEGLLGSSPISELGKGKR